ncbi:MAG: hypothetical protein HZB39_13410 [Planctomycetes bacterium]|nr:hypothetical protein [Planctomycetota bacterium]
MIRTTAVLFAMTATSVLCAQERPLTAREAEKLIPDLFALDVRTLDGWTRAQELVARLRTVTIPSEREQRDWKKKISKTWSKGRELERAGDNWFWGGEKPKGSKQAEVPQRGRYLVGGGNEKKPKGLLIAMHGGGAGQGDASSAFGAYQGAANEFGWVVIAPEVLERTERGWTDSGTEEFVLDLVDCALRTWPIDPDHVYFAGHSMGGYGSWSLGAHHADRVAAIAPSAGAPTPIFERTPDGDRIVDIQDGIVPNLRNVFVAVYQSLDDPNVPPGPNQFAIQRVREAKERWGGFVHDYWEVDGMGHGLAPGGTVAHLMRIHKHVRQPVPEKIVWQPALTWKRQFHWLFWDRPSTTTTLVADLDRAANTVRITAGKALEGLWVLLDERVLDLGKEIAVVVDDVEVFRGPATPELGTLALTSLHPDGELQFVARVPAFKMP